MKTRKEFEAMNYQELAALYGKGFLGKSREKLISLLSGKNEIVVSKEANFKQYVSAKLLKKDFNFTEGEVSIIFYLSQNASGSTTNSTQFGKSFDVKEEERVDFYKKFYSIYGEKQLKGIGVGQFKRVINNPNGYTYDPTIGEKYNKDNFKIKYGWDFDKVFTK